MAFSITFIDAADDYEKGDSLYVWANSGLQLRTSPNSNSKTIQTLQPGTDLIVIEKTNEDFVYKLYHSSSFEKHPYLLYGNWVRVRTSRGREGFVFDSFLLKLPLNPNLDYEEYLSSITYRVDTLNANNQCDQPDIKGFCKYDIAYEFFCNEISGGGQIQLPGFTLEEAIIFWEYFLNYEEVNKINSIMKLIKNWKNTILLSDKMRTDQIKHKANITEISYIWSC